ncbi:MAG: FtsX-like permease family protein [Pseudomonadota bacterium]
MTALSVLDRKVLRDLWRIKGQAVAIIFVIASGIALFEMSNNMIIALDETMRAYYERHRFADVFAPAKRAPKNVLSEIRNLEGVSDVEGRINGGGLATVPGVDAPISARVLSYDPDRVSPINRVFLTEGRMIRTTHPDEILLLRPFADAHGLEPGDSLAMTLNGAQREFVIAGLALSPEFIYALPPGEFVVDAGRFAVLWANVETMEAAYDLDGAFNEAVLTISRTAQVDSLIQSLDRLMAPYGATGAIARADQVSNKYLVEELKQLSTMTTVMTPIFLGVAIFLLNIVITRLVQTEREQIGLLKAFGYSNGDIGLHYLKFVLAIALGGALLGWLGGQYLGAVISEIYRLYFHFPFLLYGAEWSTVGGSILISASAASLGAYAAIRGAVVLSPAVAMRPPAPPNYARGTGLTEAMMRALDQPSRMILRRVARQPFRAGLTVLGVGAAMGLAVMMRFNFNATDYMLDVSFNVTDRSDVFVTFPEPVSGAAIHEIEKIDGVLYTEPFRSAPVVFRNERIEYLGAITGLPANPVLNRAVDSDLRNVPIRGDGIVLSEQLAELLSVNVGEAVTVSVKEGRRPTLELPVSGKVEALIGTPAYMTMDSLNRALKEPYRMSGAYLKIDPEQRTAVYEQLKSVPKVAGVSLRREAYHNFKEMIDQGPGTFRNIMAVFSIVIAAGVVYNAARIAFIERSHDLASLRVLGFTKIEAGYVLLGELALLTLLALPIGSLIGYGLWAYLAGALSTELYQIPTVYREDSLGQSAIVVLVAAVIAAAFVQRDINKLDIAAALKTRE